MKGWGTYNLQKIKEITENLTNMSNFHTKS